MKVEKQIVNDFLSENNLEYCFNGLKNDVHKAYRLSKLIIEDINNQKNNLDKYINILDNLVSKEKVVYTVISDFLTKEYSEPIKRPFMNFLLDIVKNYFKFDLEILKEIGI